MSPGACQPGRGLNPAGRVCGGFSKKPLSLAPLKGTLFPFRPPLFAGRFGMVDSQEKPNAFLKLLSYLAFRFQKWSQFGGVTLVFKHVSFGG